MLYFFWYTVSNGGFMNEVNDEAVTTSGGGETSEQIGEVAGGMANQMGDAMAEVGGEEEPLPSGTNKKTRRGKGTRGGRRGRRADGETDDVGSTG